MKSTSINNSSPMFSSLWKETLPCPICLPSAPGNYQSVFRLWICLFWYISCKWKHIMSFVSDLTQHSVLRFIHVVACISTSFFFMTEIYVIVHVYICVCILVSPSPHQYLLFSFLKNIAICLVFKMYLAPVHLQIIPNV